MRMTKNYEKLLMLREEVQLQLDLQNSYFDTARKRLRKMHRMMDEYLRQSKITKFYYKKEQKKLHTYDVIFEERDIRKKTKGWNHRTYIVNKSHFSED